MKYFPILQELFESDTIIFLLIGLAISIFTLAKLLSNRKKNVIALACSFGVYIICELFSIIHTNFMLELILLFFGTLSIGCMIGYGIMLLIQMFRRKNRQISY